VNLLSNAHLAEEALKELHEASKGQSVVGNNTLDLMKFAKMGRVYRFISEIVVVSSCSQAGESRIELTGTLYQ
jgi:hypothetical protein